MSAREKSSYQTLLSYQRRDLAAWKELLKPIHYMELEQLIKDYTYPAPGGLETMDVFIDSTQFDRISECVPRGQGIDDLVSQIKYNIKDRLIDHDDAAKHYEAV